MDEPKKDSCETYISLRYEGEKRRYYDKESYYKDIADKKLIPRLIRKEKWYKYGKLHREDDPAWRLYGLNGILLEERWFHNGNRYCKDGPWCRKWSGKGKLLEEWFSYEKYRKWNKNGLLIVDCEPNEHSSGVHYRKWDGNGQLLEDKYDGGSYHNWNKDGQLLQERVPITSIKYKNLMRYREWARTGQLLKETYRNSKYELHREDGPARRRWNHAGVLVLEKWYKNNNLHREDGPADREWTKKGKIMKEVWYFNGDMHREDGPAYNIYHNAFNIASLYYCHGETYKPELTKRAL